MKETSRRGFIAAVAGLAGASIVPAVIHADEGTQSTTWDLSWLEKLKGKHRQVFDVQDLEALRGVNNWLNAHKEIFQLAYPDVNAIVGIAGTAFPINASDELYRNLPIGEHWKVTDPETQKTAERNIFLDGGKTAADQSKTVRSLQSRGVVFWQCNNSLLRLSKAFAEKLHRPEAEIYEEMKNGLNPGVILVPSHAMLLGLAQEQGWTYEVLV